MPLRFDELEQAIRVDYEALCRQFGVRPVPLDIYLVDEHSTDRTAHGTDLRNAVPVYNARLLVLPVQPADLGLLYDLRTEFPPTTFEGTVWQQWRIELWHEFTHQLQDQKLNKWDRNDGSSGHTLGWNEALDLLGSAFGISGVEMKSLL